ncbi:MAG: M20/M25/M40 family metallo-hydrolase [Bacteroidales bacterium]
MKRLSLYTAIVLVALIALAVGLQAVPQSQDDPVVQKIIQLGTTDNQVMRWNDYASNRFGGRETGTNAYTDATQWAVWQFKQWGMEAELDEAGEVPVGFNRGPWFGRMLKPNGKELRFGTPSFTAGTKGVQHGGVVILKTDPYTAPAGSQGPAVNQDEVRQKRQAIVQQAIAEINANKAAFKGKWVLIGGASRGFARDGRRPNSIEAQLFPPLTKALVDAGALGTIQSAAPTTTTPSPTMAGQSWPPINILDGYAESWDKLPVLPDIKLLNTQYDEIKGLAEKNQPVDLEFDIRNWFKMGPIKYHSVVATLRGSQYPDEYVVLGGHFDCFSGATGGVDDGNGFAPSMEALRLIKAAGGKPKRSIVVILFAAEESGLVGSQAWLKNHPGIAQKVVMMINRDGSPMAITGVRVPETWYADMQKIGAPLATAFPKWPFKVEKALPRAHATSPGGTDSSSFEMQAVPTLSFATQTDYVYGYAWHTLNDLYSELVPYTEQQQESAIVHAVMAYGAANLDKPLTRAGVYLDDGLYATVTVGAPDKPANELESFMVSLDYQNAPLYTANFLRIVEGNAPVAGGRGGMPPMAPAPAAASGGRGPQPAAAGAGGGGRGAGGGRGGALLLGPPIGKILTVKGGTIAGEIVSETQKKFAVKTLPKQFNASVKHDAANVFGLLSPNGIYFTQKANPGLDRKYVALGKVIAGADVVAKLKTGESIRAIRITRVGKAATDFKADDESFKKLLEAATTKKKKTTTN